MIVATVAYSEQELERRSSAGSRLDIDSALCGFSSIEVVKSFGAGVAANVRADVASIDDLQNMLGTNFVAEEPRRMRSF
jgi:hypothetical protein